jgi:hypothetical protein
MNHDARPLKWAGIMSFRHQKLQHNSEIHCAATSLGSSGNLMILQSVRLGSEEMRGC